MNTKNWETVIHGTSISEESINTVPIAMTIAGSDSGGGAGIQADLHTFSANGVFGTSAITVLTAQNSQKVVDVFPISGQFVAKQIQAVISDMDVKACKTGMLFNKDIIESVSSEVSKWKDVKLVVDPVMVATSGCILLKPEAIEEYITDFMPKAYCITPNIAEVQEILRFFNMFFEIKSVADMKKSAKEIGDRIKCKYVLVKGGHLNNQECSIDVLYDVTNNTFEEFTGEFIHSLNTHGTGGSDNSKFSTWQRYQDFCG